MKNTIRRLFTIPIILCFSILLLKTQDVSATDFSSEPVLCLPGVYLTLISECHPNGPSEYLYKMAHNGVSFPIQDPPSISPRLENIYVDYSYGRVVTSNAPVYGSIDDAQSANKKSAVRRINADFSYISYTDEEFVDGKRFYLVAAGNWMTANDVSRVTAPRFQGLVFAKTPPLAFGWVLTYLSPTTSVETKYSPGYEKNDYTGRYINNHEIVWVYSVEFIDNIEWYMVGINEWVPQNVVARVIPRTIPPPGIPGDRWIEINLFEQTIAVYDNHQLVYASLIASGMEPFWTRPGIFQIYTKLDSTPMRGAFETDGSPGYYLEDVPWTMYYDQARAIHGAYWRANLGFPQSHGCVNLSIGDSRWIYDWAEKGDWVFVWDPSGKTPEDPDVYGEGGA